VGDPEQRQAWNTGSKFTVLFVATQRSLKNAEDEWVSKVEWHRVAISDFALEANFLCETSADPLPPADWFR
jgi:single-stranded DNA-binding protein